MPGTVTYCRHLAASQFPPLQAGSAVPPACAASERQTSSCGEQNRSLAGRKAGGPVPHRWGSKRGPDVTLRFSLRGEPGDPLVRRSGLSVAPRTLGP